MPRKNTSIDQPEDQEKYVLQKLQRAERIMKNLRKKHRTLNRRWDPFDDQDGKESPYLRKG